MEQCMSRLDVAMFNAILREPGNEVPTDPVSDPISDSRVLPIASGKASVGAGALLKRTVSNINLSLMTGLSHVSKWVIFYTGKSMSCYQVGLFG